MTTRIRKVITAIDANGNAFSEQHTETLVDGKWFQNDPTTLTDGSAWADQYNAALEATNAALVSAHKTELDSVQAALTTANATIADLEARIAALLTELPFNPREISVGAFKARLFSVLQAEDIVRWYAAPTDSELELIAGKITNWDNKFPIRLDSDELLLPLGKLVSINLLTVAEVVNLRRDCTRAEAFIPLP
jgi:hypothetical protein